MTRKHDDAYDCFGHFGVGGAAVGVHGFALRMRAQRPSRRSLFRRRRSMRLRLLAAACRTSSWPAAASGACRRFTSTPRASPRRFPAIRAARRRPRITRWSARSAPGTPKSVSVTFDPQQISLGKILQIYFSVAHNPTELNYQGPDSGPSIPLGNLLCQRRAEAGRRGLHRAIATGARFQRVDRDQARAARPGSIRLKTIIRTLSSCTRPIPISSSTTSPRSTTSSGCSRTIIATRRSP